MPRRIDVFYAFPSRPSHVPETIANAIDGLRADRTIREVPVRFRPWPEMLPTGKRLLTEIEDNISRCNIFACDLTYPNPNVAFELGLAIGRFKRLWITLNTSIEEASARYKQVFEGIFGAGYSGYENYQEIRDTFLRERPWRSLDEHLLHESYRRQGPRQELPTLLYVQPHITTDAVLSVLEQLNRSVFSDYCIVDDPRENSGPTLEWYAEKIYVSDAVVVHLLNPEHRDYLPYNTKASFVAGLSFGLRKPTLMLAHLPFDPPTDYRLLLRSHSTAAEAATQTENWIQELNLPRRRQRRPAEDVRRNTRNLELRNLSVGESVAENESLRLDEYFVETDTYFQALESQISIVLGRRGTGKTATLIAMQIELSSDRRNHVCTVKPVGYELDGLVSLLREDLRHAERGYLLDSLWKFLLYSELARSVASEISSRPPHQLRTEHENRFMEYLEANGALLGVPFSQRLDRAVKSLAGLSRIASSDEQRIRISELLHQGPVGILRHGLGEVLADKHKVAMLIDRLDESWRPGRETLVLSELLLALLRVSQDIFEDFHHQDQAQKSINLSLTIFLRSDIFAYIQPHTAEQDKLPIRRVTWNDSEMLMRVINERLLFRIPPNIESDDIWNQLFDPQVAGYSTKAFILENTLPRPRDVIYFVREAISGANNRSHDRVLAADLLDARNKYSRYVFTSILAEDDPQRAHLRDVLYQFSGSTKRLPASEVHQKIVSAGVPDEDTEFYFNLLCDVNFLGIQTTTGYRLSADEDDTRTLRGVARSIAQSNGAAEESYLINAAFHHVLQIDSRD